MPEPLAEGDTVRKRIIYTPFDEHQRQNLRGIGDKLDGIADLIGGWSAKSDCRQTGVSLHLKFEKKVDVQTTWEFAETLQTCPALLNDAACKLLAADDEIVRLRALLAEHDCVDL